MLKRQLGGLIISALACTALPALSFASFDDAGGKIHDQITRDALAGTISDANLNFLIKAVDSQDAPSGDGKGESRRHFEGGNFTAALNYIDREKKTALNYAVNADSDPTSRAQALRHFGMALHTAQDFYSKTNYVELQFEDGARRADPYNAELVDWARVPDGYVGKKSGEALKPGAPAASFNKDNPSTAASKTAVSDTNYFKIARDLAVRETQRQWTLFEALIRGRCHGRADAVIAALKQASPAEGASATEAPEIDD